MKISLCVSPEHTHLVQPLTTKLHAHLNTDLFFCPPGHPTTLLRESDAVLIFVDANGYSADCVEAARAESAVLIAVLVNGLVPAPNDELLIDIPAFPLRSTHSDTDIPPIVQTVVERTERLSQARHEYNNIAAVTALSSSPKVLAQARRLLVELRTKYPEYKADPEGLDRLLSIETQP
jgi:hypothetical protein